MINSADEAGDWLRRNYPAEFGSEKLLIIRTIYKESETNLFAMPFNPVSPRDGKRRAK